MVKLFNCATKRKGSFLSAWPELYSPIVAGNGAHVARSVSVVFASSAQ